MKPLNRAREIIQAGIKIRGAKVIIVLWFADDLTVLTESIEHI